MSDRSRLATLPLGPLRAFDAAARHGSFKTAAFDLAVTPAAVSHQIKALEAHLGVALFERLNRGLRLTTAGQRLAAVTADSFARLEAGLRDLDASGLTKGVATLTISSAPSIAAKWLVPRLHRFQAAHPQIELRLQSGDSLADVTAGAVDIALRYGTGAYGADVTETQLWPKGEIVVVCAPSLAAAGELRRPQDVLAHPLLRTAMPARRQNVAKAAAGRTDAELGGWPSWLAAAGIKASALKPNTLRGPLFGSSHLAIDAAASGRGLALAPRILVAEDIAAGRLVEPFRIAVPDPFAYWLVHATRRAAEPRIRAFVRWVREEAAAG